MYQLSSKLSEKCFCLKMLVPKYLFAVSHIAVTPSLSFGKQESLQSREVHQLFFPIIMVNITWFVTVSEMTVKNLCFIYSKISSKQFNLTFVQAWVGHAPACVCVRVKTGCHVLHIHSPSILRGRGPQALSRLAYFDVFILPWLGAILDSQNRQVCEGVEFFFSPSQRTLLQ